MGNRLLGQARHRWLALRPDVGRDEPGHHNDEWRKVRVMDVARRVVSQRAISKRYLIFTSPTTSPPFASTAWTQRLLKPSFNSGYWAIIALARFRASA